MTTAEIERIAKAVLGRSGGTLRTATLDHGVWTIDYNHPRADPLRLMAKVTDRSVASDADLLQAEKELGRQVGMGIASMD